jgi:hypothetical protein
VPLARDLHPEFGYVGSAPRLFRKLGLVIVFMVFGFIAVGSGMTVFMTAPEPDPMHAMALAPAETLKKGVPIVLPATPAEKALTQSASGQKGDRGDDGSRTVASKPSCRDIGVDQTSDCRVAVRPMRARPVPALNDRPLIATVPIGHRDEPAVSLLSEPPITVTATPPAEESIPSPTPEVAPGPATPPPVAKKQRARAHVQRREAYAPSHTYGYSSRISTGGGYAGLW